MQQPAAAAFFFALLSLTFFCLQMGTTSPAVTWTHQLQLSTKTHERISKSLLTAYRALTARRLCALRTSTLCACIATDILCTNGASEMMSGVSIPWCAFKQDTSVSTGYLAVESSRLSQSFQHSSQCGYCIPTLPPDHVAVMLITIRPHPIHLFTRATLSMLLPIHTHNKGHCC